MLVEMDLDLEHFVLKSIEIMSQLFKGAAVIIAVVYSVCCSPYHRSHSRYHKRESPHTGNFTVHLQYPLIVQSTIFLSEMKPTSSLLTFHASLLPSFSFFPNGTSLGCGLTTHSVKEVCCDKTGPCHCFHSSQRGLQR